MALTCNYCNLKFVNKTKLLIHVELTHEHEPHFILNCDDISCPKNFKTVRSYKWHVKKYHRCIRKAALPVILKCPYCDHKAESYAKQITHFRVHFKSLSKVKCPVNGCSKYYSVYTSLTSHFSRVHKRTVLLSNPILDFDFLPEDENQDADLPEQPISDLNIVNAESIKEKFGLFLLKLFSKYMLPESAIQEVVDTTLSIHNLELDFFSFKLDEIFLKHNTNVAPEFKNDLTHFFNAYNENFLSEFKSAHKRLKSFKKRFGYVESQEVFLGRNAKRQKRSFQYVPLLENLKRLLQHKHVFEQVYYSQSHVAGCYTDFTDGVYFQNNSLLNSSSDLQPRLSLIFYFDEFEIANPIGSHRKIHKMAAFYYMLGNIEPESRSSLHVTQLSIMCRATDIKEFGLQNILQPLIRDLKTLSNEGVFVPGKGFFKGGIAFFCGDNLGSNFLGGFTESFSPNVKHVCRTCLIDNNKMQTEFRSSEFPMRTVDHYQETIVQAEEDTNLFHEWGIKQKSPLLDIPNFHVLTGLPPDAMHDVLEGVVPYEVQIVLSKLISEKFFTLKFLNQRIHHFPYGSTDITNKPVEQTLKDGLIGTAAENWCLLRMLPFLIGFKVPNDNPYWEFLMHLKYIVRLIFAPSFTLSLISLLQSELEDHLYRFKELFPTRRIKPKQHYILHYPQHILNFGPLIRYNCMRFEGKHSFFKDVVRHAKQFKNPPLTLALRHQLLQTYYSSSDSFFKPDISVFGCAALNFNILNSQIKGVIVDRINEKGCVMQVTKALVKGTQYVPNQFLAVDCFSGSIVFGEILSILFVEGILWFVMKKYHSEPYEHFESLQLHCMNQYVCVKHNELIDPFPLSLYSLVMQGEKNNFLSLKHQILENN